MISTMRTLREDAPIAKRPTVAGWAIFSEDSNDSPLDVSPDFYDPDNDEINDTPEAKDAVRKRLTAWENGEWCFTGVRASALVRVPIGGREVFEFEIVSPGLWGIESDSERSYFDQVGDDQLGELRSILEALNVDASLQEDRTKRWGR